MKQTILSLLSVIISFMCVKSEKSFSEEPRNPVTAYTVKNIRYEFNDSVTYFIVLKNIHSCNNCFSSINDYIVELKKTDSVMVLSLTECDSNSLSRKRCYADSRLLMSNFDNYLFHYEHASESIKGTPEIMIVKRGRVTTIPYENMFDIWSMELTPSTKEQILHLLREN